MLDAVVANSALTALVSSLVSALVSAAIVAVRLGVDRGSARRGEIDAMREGIKSLLRGEIMHLHHECVRRGNTTTVEKEVMQRNYEAYAGLNGNGVAKTLYEEFMRLPTIDE